jgi:oxygen-independent coproporphyrinogen-3 oxidase
MKILDLVDRSPLSFTIQYPPSRLFFQERYRAPIDPAAVAALPRMLLYVHVPFCEARCYYCNFAVDVRGQETLHARYVEGLVSRLDRLRQVTSCSVPGIDIGGGTPTRLSPRLLQRLLEALAPWRSRAEIPFPLSIETTPSIAATRPEVLAVLQAGGVDRVSMGLQSTNDELLESVNRKAQQAMAEKAVAHLSGFRRKNIDLIFGLPGQTRAQWREDMDRVADMPVDSVTTYDCLYRGHGRAMPRMTAHRPTPKEYGALYEIAYERLTSAGFQAPYGSVNFSRHAGETGTSPYFEGRLLDGLPYVGVGNYASSLVGDRWWFAPHSVGDWLRSPELLPAGDSYRLPASELMAKYVLLSLNFGFVDSARFAVVFGVSLKDAFGDRLTHAVERGWLRPVQGRFEVCPGSFRAMPWIRGLFYSQEAVLWLQRHLD